MRLEIGVDDDGDDVLDVDEVDATTITCHVPGTSTPPEGPEGTGEILLGGGGATTTPGIGGSATITHGASGGGSLAVFRTGAATASCTIPARTPVLGAHPYTLAQSVVVPEIIAGKAGPAAGVLYASGPDGSSSKLFVSDGGTAGDETPITSLTIPAGMTLTFGGAGTAALELRLSDDLVNGGTILRNGALNRSLTLDARAYVGLAGSRIDLRGPSAGGDLAIRVDEVLLNLGELDTSGALGPSSGGDAGGIELTARAGSVENGAELRAVGGAGTDASSKGGLGGRIELSATGGRVCNGGDLVATGGGARGEAGAAGEIALESRPLDLVNHGRLDAQGGVSSSCLGPCKGGAGGKITLTSTGGGIFNQGSLGAGGGHSPTVAASCGGAGGQIEIRATVDANAAVTHNQGTIQLSGTIDARGGNGGENAACNGGGPGGSLEIEAVPRHPLGQELLLLGYRRIVVRGGDSATNAGAQAGSFTLLRSAGLDAPATIGAILNYADVDASGGSAGEFFGVGTGGQILMLYGGGARAISGLGTNRVINAGRLATDGAMGGYGGSAFSPEHTAVLYGPEGVVSSGEIRTGGGNGTGFGFGTGGAGGGIVLASDVGQVENRAALTSSGGNDTFGGRAGRLCLQGAFVVNSGTLTAHGGDGADGAAGAGNDIILSSFAQPSLNSGTLSAGAGTGSPAAASGRILVDSFPDRCVPPELLPQPR